MKIDTKQIIIGSLFFSVFFLFIILGKRNKEIKEKSISENKIESVCKIYRLQRGKNFNRCYYKFYFNGIVYYGSQNIRGEKKEEIVGKYYKIIFSSKNRKYSKMFVENEVKDFSEIRSAGFKL